MADPRFFTLAGPYRLAELAELSGADIPRGSDPDAVYRDVAPLETAGPDDVSFLDNKKYLNALASSKAGVCVLRSDMSDRAPEGMALLISDQSYKAYALIAKAFYPAQPYDPGVAATACVDESAKIGAGSVIMAGAVVGRNAEIGARCQIGANTVIGEAVRIGDDAIIGANATLSHCLIGARVHIYPGVRIGQRGFGFAIDPAGHVKVPQLGRVVIEDDVEIGANCCIDRGAGPDTVIGAGAMLDNMVHIAHNVKVGRGCILAGQTGIAGSSELGDGAMMGGQSGVTGHIKIGAGAQIAGQSGVVRDLAPGERVFGTPAKPVRQFFKEALTIEKLSAIKKGK